MCLCDYIELYLFSPLHFCIILVLHILYSIDPYREHIASTQGTLDNLGSLCYLCLLALQIVPRPNW